MMILRKKGFYSRATTLIFQDDKASATHDQVMNDLASYTPEHVLRSQGIRNIHLNGWVLP